MKKTFFAIGIILMMALTFSSCDGTKKQNEESQTPTTKVENPPEVPEGVKLSEEHPADLLPIMEGAIIESSSVDGDKVICTYIIEKTEEEVMSFYKDKFSTEENFEEIPYSNMTGTKHNKDGKVITMLVQNYNDMAMEPKPENANKVLVTLQSLPVS